MIIRHLGSLVFGVFAMLSPLLNVTRPCRPRLLVLYGIQSSVRGMEEGSDAIGILRITGDAYADRKKWLLGIPQK